MLFSAVKESARKLSAYEGEGFSFAVADERASWTQGGITPMNLLIIGNGLDLDLKLPTKYSDFLKFSKSFTFFFKYQDIEKIYEFDIHNHSVVDSRYDKKSISPNLNEPYEKWKEILEKFDESFSHKFINKACKDFFYCVHNNCWIKYFNERYQKHLIAGENWIDIENEIQNVIHTLEEKKIQNYG